MRLFAQLGWYFRREWQRYLGAVALLIIIAILQLVSPKVVGIVVDGVTQKQFTHQQVWMWVAALVAIAVVTYLLRYVWRVWLFGAPISSPLNCARISTASSAASTRNFICATAPAI